MLRSYLLLFMAQGSFALTCYNSTRVTESHKIEYKSYETSEQACADACTANDKCIGYLSNENGGRIECVQFGPAKEVMCTLPIFINMKMTCPDGVEDTSRCSHYHSLLPAKMAEETYVLNNLRMTKSITCVADNCTCPTGQFMVLGAASGCVSGLRLKWISGWRFYATHPIACMLYQGVPSELLNARCEMLWAPLEQGNYSVPLVTNGYLREKEIVCPKGLSTIDAGSEKNILNASPDALHWKDEKGFILDNDPIIFAHCNL